MLLRAAGLLIDRGDWLEPGLLGCAYPRRPAALAALANQGVSVVINLHERGQDPVRLAQFGLSEIHLPVADFTAPGQDQLQAGVRAITETVAAGQRVAVHCGGGLGRTGTLLACYLVQQGIPAKHAIARVRSLRPGSVETRAQALAVEAFEQQLAGTGEA
jgi:atypical dual specificity phosphatase